MTDSDASRRSDDVARLEEQLRSLQATLRMLAGALCLTLLTTGLLLPIWHETRDGEPSTVRVVTAGFQGWSQADGDGAIIAIAVGFLGLLAVVLVLAALLLVGLAGGRTNGLLRATVGILAVVGTAVAMLLSAIAAGSDTSGSSGGWGAVVLMAGVVLSLVTLADRGLQQTGATLSR